MKKILLGLLITVAFSYPAAAQPDPEFRRLFKLVGPTVVKVTFRVDDEKSHICAGTVISTQLKHVLTAKHCVEIEEGKLVPVLVNGMPATLLKHDDHLALLVAPSLPDDYPDTKVRRDGIYIGDVVYAFGFGLNFPTMIVRRVMWIFHVGGKFQEEFTVDQNYIEGMSGGPVVDHNGKIVGVIQSSAPIFGNASGPGMIRRFLGME